MFTIKRYFKSIIRTLFMIVFFSFFLTFLYYSDWISQNTFSFLQFFGFLFILFWNSYCLGKKSSKKGYMEGIKYGMIIIISFLIPTILYSKYQWKIIFYYSLILFTTIIGSVFGINKKKAS